MCKFDVKARVLETNEIVVVDDEGAFPNNPWNWYSAMWHTTEDGRIFHDDDLEFLSERTWMRKKGD